MNAIPPRGYDVAVFSVQALLIDDFIRHLAAHRALHDALTSRRADAQPSFVLVASSDANLLMAIIYWCMVFGSDHRNEIHMHALRPDSADAFKEAFCTNLNIPEQEWTDYRESMRVFRNKFAAHRDLQTTRPAVASANTGGEPRLEWRGPVPLLDLAEKAAFFWDDWVRTVISPDVYHEAPLRDIAVHAATRAAQEVSAISEGILRAKTFAYSEYME